VTAFPLKTQTTMKTPMKRFLIPLLVLSLAATSPGQMDEAFSKQVAAVLKECQTVKPGKTTREELAKIFVTEGGISTPIQQTFVHRSCPYIKVRVEFELVDPAKAKELMEGMPQDQVKKISEPFLEWSVID